MKAMFAFILLLSVPASAQDGLQKALGAAQDAVKKAGVKPDASEARRRRALATTLTAMNDGVPVGESIVSYIRAKKIVVDFDKVEGLSGTVFDPQQGTIVSLGSALPAYPRVYAPRIAREVSALMLSDMSESAEKEYMRRSLEVRSWIELGGDPKTLPVIEYLAQYEDAALAAEFKLWLDHDSQTALHKIGKAAGKRILPDLIDELNNYLRAARMSPETRKQKEAEWAALEAANTRFVDFLFDEMMWKRLYP